MTIFLHFCLLNVTVDNKNDPSSMNITVNLFQAIFDMSDLSSLSAVGVLNSVGAKIPNSLGEII